MEFVPRTVAQIHISYYKTRTIVEWHTNYVLRIPSYQGIQRSILSQHFQ